MQNIINFENIVNDKKVSVNLVNELIGRCHYQPRWENIKVSRTARNVVEYIRENPTHKCS